MKIVKEILAKIVPARSMKIEVSSYNVKELELCAPLTANVNDKGTGFAGSIYSTLVLSGWSLVTQYLADQGIGAQVVIASSSTEYKAPVEGDLSACARFVDTTDAQQLLVKIDERGRGKVAVESTLSSNGKVCAVFTGLYVAKSV